MARESSTSLRRMTLVAVATLTASAALAEELSDPPSAPAAAIVPAVPAKPARHSAAHRAKVATAARRTAVPASARLPAETPAVPAADLAVAKPIPQADPVAFGMKWNGSNDSAGQTRIENLNGNAAGTGAEVGMKLHF